jgi:hypothetical protein
MTIPIWVILIAFLVFLGLYLAGQHGADRLGRASLATRWQRQKTASRKQMTTVWLFTLIALPVVLLQAKTSWVNRGLVLIAFLAFLGLGTAWLSSRDDR